jgi:hypothetical protein
MFFCFSSCFFRFIVFLAEKIQICWFDKTSTLTTNQNVTKGTGVEYVVCFGSLIHVCFICLCLFFVAKKSKFIDTIGGSN